MLRELLATRNDWYLTLLRLAAGIMILPHGLQKTFGWFGGPGFSKMMAGFTQGAHIPAVFAFLAIMAEFLGGIGLLIGLELYCILALAVQSAEEAVLPAAEREVCHRGRDADIYTHVASRHSVAELAGSRAARREDGRRIAVRTPRHHFDGLVD